MAEGMFPGVKFFTVHTKQESADLCIFVGTDWAVLAFGGSEREILCDLLTSALVEDSIHFAGHARVRRRYYQAMRSAIGDSRTIRYSVEPPVSMPGRLDATALDLIKAMNKEDKKIYITGHSRAGGLATLLGAYLHEEYRITPAAVVTFGAPPVAGNKPFVDWYRRNIHASWRFVNGTDFSSLMPPVPFTSSVRFEHVNSLIDVQDISGNQIQQNYDENEDMLDHLAKSMNLSVMFYNHNPILTLRNLRLAGIRTQHALSIQFAQRHTLQNDVGIQT
jgi:hypothetical protein